MDVHTVKLGDPVILSFASCGTCYSCTESHPAYCANTFNCNWRGQRGVFRSPVASGSDIAGHFFGQSSFGNKAVVNVRSVVSLVDSDVCKAQLKLLAPLGCGVQTGTGALINTADVKAGQEVAVIGVGGVGQSAIMVSQRAGIARAI